jgi:hypothetical protein
MPLQETDLATETTALTLATEATLATRASEATLATRASEATLATRASEATLATMLTEAAFQARINTLGQKTMANSTPVVIASDQSPIPVTPGTSTTGTNSSVAGAAADTLLLASNVNRKGATIFNDSNAKLYLLLGTTVSSLTNFTVVLSKDAYYEVPFAYSGQIRGIWASATGFARITELT